MKTMSENLNVFNTLAATLGDYELQEAINILLVEKKARHGAALLEAKSTLLVGDKVEWYSSRNKEVRTGSVIKIKTKKAIVEEAKMLNHWDIPMGMLKKIL